MKNILYFYKSLWFKLLIVFILLLFITSNVRVYLLSKDKVFSELNKIKHHKTALLLGTSRYLKSGVSNEYFDHRVKACSELYFAGKIDRILISGDNSRKDYNEPQDMKDELIKKGVPADKIFLDFAGFDTYDSVLRAKMVFGQDSFIVVSQKFQNQRAVYIAQRNGIDAIGYNASDVQKMAGLKTKIREYFARVKAYVEVNLGIQPYYLGEPVKIS